MPGAASADGRRQTSREQAPAARSRVPAPPGDDVLRIFVSTDNHLGHKESHEVRKDDSFRAVEEACSPCFYAMLMCSCSAPAAACRVR